MHHLVLSITQRCLQSRTNLRSKGKKLGNALACLGNAWVSLSSTTCAGVNKDLGQGNPADGPSQNLWDRLARTMQVQPVLLNKQDDTSFALASTASKAFSRRVQINTVGGKGSVRIKVCC